MGGAERESSVKTYGYVQFLEVGERGEKGRFIKLRFGIWILRHI